MSFTVVYSSIAARCNLRKVAFASAGVAVGLGTFLAIRKMTRAAAVVAVEKSEIKKGREEPCEGCDCGLMEPGPLEGTMHPYERHVIICSGHEDWPKVIEEEEHSLAESIFNMCLGAGLIWTKKVAKQAETNGHATPKNRVKITACSEPSRGPEGTTDVIVYPEGLIYSLSPGDMSTLELFVKSQLTNGEVAAELHPKPVPYHKMVLVCTHMSRDKRCGRAGPQVLEEMAKDVRARGVSTDTIALRGSSHFGGHRFAGVLIIYPQGDWYGLVTKKNASAIVDKCVLGTERLKANWRGNMSNPGVKTEPVSAKAADTAPDASNPSSQTLEPSVANERKGMIRRDSMEAA